MSCKNPLLGIPEGNKKDGTLSYKVIGKYDRDLKTFYPGAIAIPCGHCLGCRLDYSRSWADRMMLELDHTGKAIFVTLTYNNENVPFVLDEEYECALTLQKRDLQLFFKRLRKYFDDKEIRYYAVGEYGTHTLRPHYHAIIFGLSLEDFSDRVLFGKNKLGQCHYQSSCLERVWNQGFVLLADVSWQTCAYVARYVQKKVFHGKQNPNVAFGLAQPEFSVASRRPGIGGFYLRDHPELFETSKIFVRGKPDGIEIPKYFLRKLKERPHENLTGEKFCENPLYNEDLYDKIVSARREFADDKVFLKMLQTDHTFLEQLDIEESELMNRTAILKRL